MDDMAHEPQHQKGRDTDWKAVTVAALVLLVSLGLLAYSAAGSYESLRALASGHGVPLPQFFPAGLDGGLVGVITADIGLTWLGMPLAWLRQVARLFAVGTVAANVAAGWPDLIGAGLRVCAPLLIVIISEAVRQILLRRSRGDTRDPVPFARWVLAPTSTFRLWRRMKLWRIDSYATAVDLEISRRHAIEQLTSHYRGKDWRKATPGDLVWMLDNGLRMGEALAAVAEILAPPRVPVTATPGTRQARQAGTRQKQGARRVPADPDLADLDAANAAMILLEREPGISGSALGPRVGKSKSWGRDFKNRVGAKAPSTGPIARVEG